MDTFASDDELDDLEKKEKYKLGDFTKGAIKKVKKKIDEKKPKDEERTGYPLTQIKMALAPETMTTQGD